MKRIGLVASVLTLTSLAAAQATFETDAEAKVWGPGGGSSQSDRNSGPEASASAGAASGSASSSAWGSMFSVKAHAAATSNGAYGSDGWARADVTDLLLVQGSKTGGGTIRMGIRLGGTATASFSGMIDPKLDWWSEAKASVAIRVNGVLEDSFETKYSVNRIYPQGKLTPFKDRTYVDIPFEFGQSLYLNTFVYAGVSIRNGSGAGIADFGHTFEWSGVQGVFDNEGNAITDYKISSASGTDYVNPVPEPASVVALGAGAVALLKRRMKRTS